MRTPASIGPNRSRNGDVHGSRIAVRRLNSVVAAALLTLWMSLVPCSAATTTAAKTVATTAEPVESLERFHADPIIWLGVRVGSVPFSFARENGAPAGFSVDLCMKIVDALREELKLPKLRVQHLFVTSDTRFDALLGHKIDMECGVTTNTVERQQRAAFSLNTFISGIRMATRKNAGIDDLHGLSGKSAVVAKGSTGDLLFQRRAQQFGVDAKLIRAPDSPDAFRTLAEGRATAFINDEVLLAGAIANSQKPEEFEIVGPYLSIEPYGLMIRKSDHELLRVANAALRMVYGSGEIFTIYERWFNTEKFRFPMNRLTRDSFVAPSDMHATNF